MLQFNDNKDNRTLLMQGYEEMLHVMQLLLVMQQQGCTHNTIRTTGQQQCMGYVAWCGDNNTRSKFGNK